MNTNTAKRAGKRSIKSIAIHQLESLSPISSELEVLSEGDITTQKKTAFNEAEYVPLDGTAFIH